MTKICRNSLVVVLGFISMSVCLAPRPSRATDDVATTVTVDSEEARSHRLGAFAFIRTSFSSMTRNQRYTLAMEGVHVHAIVNPEGSVISAACVACSAGLASDAETVVKATTYRPFEKDGRAVTVQFNVRVLVLPPERDKARHVSFPKIHDWTRILITLKRTVCYGFCPAYTVAIQGDGTVIFKGEKPYEYLGEHRTRISRRDLLRLLGGFRDADFYSLSDEYVFDVYDVPTFEISIEMDGQQKKVKDHEGLNVGMPVSIVDLENLIDDVASSERWTKISSRR